MRFKITDNRSGEQYNVEEPKRQAIARPLLKGKQQLKHHTQEKDADESLTQEEIVGLKKLAKLSPKLETLIEKLEDLEKEDTSIKEEEKEEEVEEEIEPEDDDIDIEEIEEEKEEIKEDTDKDDDFDDLDADDDAEEVEDEDEEIVENDGSIDDTDEVIFDKKRKCDSKKSIGSLEKPTKDSLNDKEIDEQNEIAEAWKMRYKGGK